MYCWEPMNILLYIFFIFPDRYLFERIDGRVRGNMRQAAIDRFSKPGTNDMSQHDVVLSFWNRYEHRYIGVKLTPWCDDKDCAFLPTVLVTLHQIWSRTFKCTSPHFIFKTNSPPPPSKKWGDVPTESGINLNWKEFKWHILKISNLWILMYDFSLVWSLKSFLHLYCIVDLICFYLTNIYLVKVFWKKILNVQNVKSVSIDILDFDVKSCLFSL